MDKITATKLKRGTDYAVMQNGRRVGAIRRTLDGWAFNPSHTKSYGDAYPTPNECFEALLKSSRGE